MIETIGSLIRYIVIIIFLGTILEMVLPQGVFRRYLRMLMGILLILTLLTPLQKITRMAPHWGAPVLPGASVGEAALSDILQKGEIRYRDNINLALQEYQKGVFSLLEGELAREFGQKLQRLEVSMEEDLASENFGSLESIYAEVRKVQAPVHAETGGKVKEIRITVEVNVVGEGPMEEDSLTRGTSAGQVGGRAQEVDDQPAPGMSDRPVSDGSPRSGNEGNGRGAAEKNELPALGGYDQPASGEKKRLASEGIGLPAAERNQLVLEGPARSIKEDNSRLAPEQNDRPAKAAAGYDKEGEMCRFIAAYFQLPLEKVAVKILP